LAKDWKNNTRLKKNSNNNWSCNYGVGNELLIETSTTCAYLIQNTRPHLGTNGIRSSILLKWPIAASPAGMTQTITLLPAANYHD
jgi:hypothetical protein